MSLKFEIADWKLELTWEALHIHPKGEASVHPKLPYPSDSHRSNFKRNNITDYLLFNPFTHAQNSTETQE